MSRQPFKILVVDDEETVRHLLRLYLGKEGYMILEAENGLRAVDLARKEKPDLCLLDIMMKGMDGYEALQKIREFSNMPVIMVSAKGEDTDKILGLDLGADDYLAKPFNPLEAVARVNANLRRFYSLGSRTAEETTEKNLIRVQDLILDPESCVLMKEDTPIVLTAVEYRIMELFMKNPGKVFTKQQLFEYGWEERYIVADNNIMVCISKLRSKLDADNSRYITTLRGIGYRMENRAPEERRKGAR